MKKLIALSLYFIMINATAKEGKYIEALTKQIKALYEAKSSENLINAINATERISQAESEKWEPGYYVGFGYIMLATRETEATKKDGYLDRAKSEVERITKLSPGNSEIIALEGFMYMIRVSIDPASRGQQYSQLAMQSFGKALTIDSSNPRALALMAQMEFGMAKFFNQKPTTACEKANQANTLLNSGIKSENPLHPTWGKGMVDSLLKQCEEL